MDELQGLNATWEHHLNAWHAQMWERMRTFGVTAHWVDPMNRFRITLKERVDSGQTYHLAKDDFQFVIQLGTEPLTWGTLNGAQPRELVIGLLIQAANALERRGLSVMPQIPDDTA